MPVPETLANDINGKYLKPKTKSTSNNINKSASSAPQYRNWTLLLTPDTPKVIVSPKRLSLTVYPNMIADSAKQPKIVVHWYGCKM